MIDLKNGKITSNRWKPFRDKIAFAIVGVAILTSIFLHLEVFKTKKILAHDEGISYLAATGHQRHYALVQHGLYPFATWVSASEWKKLLQPENKFCFRTIASDLTKHDIHPPLYFWILHVWILIFNTHLWTGPSLNMMIAIISILLLYRLAHDLLHDPREAAVVSFLWASSFAVIQTSLEARPYPLLAFFTILFIQQIIRYERSETGNKPHRLLFIGITILLGMLVHYHFFLVIIGSILFLTFHLLSDHKKKWMIGLIPIFVGMLFFSLLHPHFYNSSNRYQAQIQPFRYEDLNLKFDNIRWTFYQFFGDNLPSKLLFLLLIILFIAGLFITFNKKQKKSTPFIQERNKAAVDIWYFFTWITGWIVILYILGLSPLHAMGPRYLSMAWPFFAFIPVLMIRFYFVKAKVSLLIFFCIGQLILGSIGIFSMKKTSNNIPPPQKEILDASYKIVVDNVSRGVLPRLFFYLSDDKSVFAADQEYLIRNTQKWLSKMKENSLYISNLTYGNSVQKQNEILQIIRTRFEATQSTNGIDELGTIFQIEKKF